MAINVQFIETKVTWNGLPSEVPAPPSGVIDESYPYCLITKVIRSDGSVEYFAYAVQGTFKSMLFETDDESGAVVSYEEDDGAIVFKMYQCKNGTWALIGNGLEQDNIQIRVSNKVDSNGNLFEVVWSNHDVIVVNATGVETGETYFAKSGDVTTESQTRSVTLPDIPEVAGYPYQMLIDVTGESTWFVVLYTHTPMVYEPSSNSTIIAAPHIVYSIDVSTMSEWEIFADGSTETEPLVMPIDEAPPLWSNHNILNNDTGEVYFAGTGDINHILPVIPSDLLVDYPHVAVVKNIGKGNAEGSIAYILIASKSEMVYIPAAVTSNYDSLSSISPGYKAYMYMPGEMTDWFNLNMDSDENRITDLYLGETDDPNEELHLYRSNHNIKTVTSINDDGSYVVSDEVYFAATSFTARFELDYTKFVYGGLDESVVTAPQFDIIDDEYPYAVMIKYASFVYLYTTREPLRAYTSSSNYTYLYHSDDARSYKLSTNLGGMWFYDNTVNEDNDDYIRILHEDTTMIWSNYDILAVDTDKVETGETYFTKSGDISSEDVHELDIRIFPNVPTEWMDVYPYLCAVKLVMFGMTIYAALLSDKNMSAVPIGILDPSMGFVVSNTVSSASYLYVEDTDKWDEYSANINTARDISCLGSGMLDGIIDAKGSIGWSNHNITTYAYDETIDDLVETDDIYFSGSGVVEPPEKMVVNRSFIVAMSGNTRRLTNTLDKMNTDEMTEILSNKQFNLQSKTVTPTTEQQIIKPDDSYYGLSQVIVEGVTASDAEVTLSRVNSSSYSGIAVPSCVYGNGVYVQPGTNSGLYYSTDGYVRSSTNITSGKVTNVHYLEGAWIAKVADDGLYYSKDGITWNKSNLANYNYTMARYGNGVWMILCKVTLEDSTTTYETYYSIDGCATWTQISVLSGLNLAHLVYGNGVWCAGVDNKGIYYSKDGIAWSLAQSFTNGSCNDIVYSDGMWLALFRSTNLYRSTNGITWTSFELSFGLTVNRLDVYRTGYMWYVADAYTGKVSCSKDLVNWTLCNGLDTVLPTNPILSTAVGTITYGNGVYVLSSAQAVPDSSYISYPSGLYYSKDGINWSRTNITEYGSIHIVYANGLWFAVMALGVTADLAITGHGLYYSRDGITWKQTELTGVSYGDMMYQNGHWFIYVASVTGSLNEMIYATYILYHYNTLE